MPKLGTGAGTSSTGRSAPAEIPTREGRPLSPITKSSRLLTSTEWGSNGHVLHANRRAVSTRPVAAHKRRGRSTWDLPLHQLMGAYALPRIRFKLVPQTGQTALAIRVPLSLTRTSPLASRLALHFTQ